MGSPLSPLPRRGGCYILAGMDGHAITATDVVFEYPGKRALCGVSFALPPGSITALIGPNGAGKTTLLRCLAGLEMPYSGGMTIAGVDVAASPRKAHQLTGFLPDFFGLYEELTVRQCMLYHALIHGETAMEPDALVEDVARRAGVFPLLGIEAGALSRGQKQRVALAQAIIHSPKVLLLDEPASGLDPAARREFSALLRELGGGGMTIMVSSHILSELEDYSSHLIILDHGRVVDFQPIAGLGGASHVRLAAAGDIEALATRLRGVSGVVSAHPSGGDILLEIMGGGEGRAAVLAEVVGWGVHVSDYALEERSLQDYYLERVTHADEP